MRRISLTLAVLASSALLSVAMVAPATAGNAIDTCAGCHGTNGASSDKNLPIIGGLSDRYIGDTMDEYKSGGRNNCPEYTVQSGEKKGTKTDMCHVAKDLNPADVNTVAEHYSSKPFVRAKQSADAALAQKGKLIHDEHCEKCHTENGSLPDDDAGILAGQWMPYLKVQLDDYHSGKRKIPDKMVPKVQKLGPADLDALVQFYGGAK